jgi:hypothetical protein
MPRRVLSTDDLRAALKQPNLIQRQAFDIAHSLTTHASRDSYGPESQELLLRALEHRDALGSSKIILDGLTREFGLFPYLKPETLPAGDLVAYEYHRPPHLRQQGVVFHGPQRQVYHALVSGESIVLSAPTSFGKSLLIDAIVARHQYSNILIVVPTLALIDETRRRLARVADGYTVITHPLQTPKERNIYILTQERANSIEDLSVIDFFAIDEFYKLMPQRDGDHRAGVLNHLFYRLAKLSKPFYLLGPSITSITESLAASVDCRFIHLPYHTVASDLHSVDYEDEFDGLATLCDRLTDPTLVFCRSPKRAADIAKLLIDSRSAKPNRRLRAAVRWISSNYHPDWHFARALAHGIGIHHGRIPRSLAHFTVRCFDANDIKLLICTSTLIEGVNTKAKNVIVFDNTINKTKYDFFTFNNIRGRAGRMFKHFVGNVYLFHDVPQQTLPFVDIPAFSQSAAASDSLLVQIDDEDLNAASRKRVERYGKQSHLSMATIRANAGVDPEAQIDLARALRSPAARLDLLQWTGLPTKEQLDYACKLVWDYFDGPSLGSGSVRSAAQLSRLVNRLRLKPTTKELIDEQLKYDPNPDTAVPNVLDWLRLWAMFHFPRLLNALELIQREVLGSQGLPVGSYSFFSGQVENLFLEPALVALEEYGMPLEIARKLESELGPSDGLDAVLERLRQLDMSTLNLDEFERDIVGDVVDGLRPS